MVKKGRGRREAFKPGRGARVECELWASVDPDKAGYVKFGLANAEHYITSLIGATTRLFNPAAPHLLSSSLPRACLQRGRAVESPLESPSRNPFSPQLSCLVEGWRLRLCIWARGFAPAPIRVPLTFWRVEARVTRTGLGLSSFSFLSISLLEMKCLSSYISIALICVYLS